MIREVGLSLDGGGKMAREVDEGTGRPRGQTLGAPVCRIILASAQGPGCRVARRAGPSCSLLSATTRGPINEGLKRVAGVRNDG